GAGSRRCLPVLGNAGLDLPQWVRICPHGGADPTGQSVCCGQMPPQKVSSLVRGRRPRRPAAMDACLKPARGPAADRGVRLTVASHTPEFPKLISTRLSVAGGERGTPTPEP